jgi:transcriptional regulator with XRE-family HTH domain
MTTAIAALITELRQRGSLKPTDVANIASVSPAAVSLWMSGASLPSPDAQRLMSHLRCVVDRLAERREPEEVRDWLYAKHDVLGGDRPVDLIHARRADEVLTVIDSLDGVAYA